MILVVPFSDNKNRHLNNQDTITKTMEYDIPIEFRCPISLDIMNEPLVVTHQGADYRFDELPLNTWKTTPNGDKNPLTMMSGFLGAVVKKDSELKERIEAFRLSNGLATDEVPEDIKLTPFSDYQQIQDDEEEARRLHLELNPPPRGINHRNVLILEQTNGMRYEIHMPPNLMDSFLQPHMGEERIILIQSIINMVNTMHGM